MRACVRASVRARVLSRHRTHRYHCWQQYDAYLTGETLKAAHVVQQLLVKGTTAARWRGPVVQNVVRVYPRRGNHTRLVGVGWRLGKDQGRLTVLERGARDHQVHHPGELGGTADLGHVTYQRVVEEVRVDIDELVNLRRLGLGLGGGRGLFLLQALRCLPLLSLSILCFRGRLRRRRGVHSHTAGVQRRPSTSPKGTSGNPVFAHHHARCERTDCRGRERGSSPTTQHTTGPRVSWSQGLSKGGAANTPVKPPNLSARHKARMTRR